jgi:hypothetical protein
MKAARYLYKNARTSHTEMYLRVRATVYLDFRPTFLIGRWAALPAIILNALPKRYTGMERTPSCHVPVSPLLFSRKTWAQSLRAKCLQELGAIIRFVVVVLVTISATSCNTSWTHAPHTRNRSRRGSRWSRAVQAWIHCLDSGTVIVQLDVIVQQLYPE